MGLAGASVGAMIFLADMRLIHMTEAAFNFATQQALPLEPTTVLPTIANEFCLYTIFGVSVGALVWRGAHALRVQLCLFGRERKSTRAYVRGRCIRRSSCV